jgi:hypothetical protein
MRSSDPHGGSGKHLTVIVIISIVFVDGPGPFLQEALAFNRSFGPGPVFGGNEEANRASFCFIKYLSNKDSLSYQRER